MVRDLWAIQSIVLLILQTAEKVEDIVEILVCDASELWPPLANEAVAVLVAVEVSSARDRRHRGAEAGATESLMVVFWTVATLYRVFVINWSKRTLRQRELQIV